MTMNKIESNREKVKRLLRELFQFDVQDLDFGVPRILNIRRQEIERFIEEDLIRAVEAEFKEYAKAGMVELQKEVESLKTEINRDFGEGTIDEQGHVRKHEDTPKIKDYVKKVEELKSAEISEAHMNEVFNHVYEFFSRYYDKGDFISKQRYGGRDKYYVPYNGEEVVLHWANKDQYYVKTAEYFRNYSFKAGAYRVSFLLREVEEEMNNVVGESKFFVLCDSDAVKIDDEKRNVDVYFKYRALVDEEKKRFGTRNVQEALVVAAIDGIFSETSSSRVGSELRAKVDEERTVLEKHLNNYVRRNKTDYFIHKNLKAFLERELDFYLKNEVVDLDELENLDEKSLRIARAKVKAIREISKKIILFLAQIEDFQKLLFEKKKFVIGTEYVVTLDRIKEYAGEEFLESILDEVLKNTKQLEEWKELLRIEAKSKKDLIERQTIDGKEWKKLPIDTTRFDQEFKMRLIEKLSEKNDLDEILDGILIKSENWQALNTVLNRWQGKIQCIYTDAPYNTGSDEFLYKDNYRHSSWLTMMSDRLGIAREFLKNSGVIFVSIDDNEATNLDKLLQTLFGEKNFVAKFVVLSNPRGRYLERHVATSHEYVLLYASDSSNLKLKGIPLTEKQIKEYKFTDQHGKYRLLGLRKRGAYSRKEDRPNLHFPIYYDPETKEIMLKKKQSTIEMIPKLEDGSDSVWRWSREKIEKDRHLLIVKGVGDRYDIFQKDYLTENKTLKPRTIWMEKSLNYEKGKEVLKDLFGFSPYSYPKPMGLLEKIVNLSTNSNDIVMDFFVGSGTTAHAILKTNKEGRGKRKFILIEMAEYFDTITMPRIKKIAYSFDWREGKPTKANGLGIFFKYHYLEQYEDTLNNIAFIEKDKTVQETLDEFGDYLLRQMLEFETRGSPTRLNIEKFRQPFDYKIMVTTGGEKRLATVDLIETFNYLLGITVEKFRAFKDKDREYRCILGKRKEENVAIIWRNTTSINLKRDKEFVETSILAGAKPDRIFINGDSLVENAEPIEPEFKRLMGA